MCDEINATGVQIQSKVDSQPYSLLCVQQRTIEEMDCWFLIVHSSSQELFLIDHLPSCVNTCLRRREWAFFCFIFNMIKL